MRLKSLIKDTAIYGLSSIVGRFLNYLLVPLYTTRIAASSGGYGVVTNLYAYTALLLAILTFGMETTLFRFSGKEEEDPERVYGTTLKMVGSVALAFIIGVFALLRPISTAMGYASHPEYVGCMALVVGMDAFQAIMFSRLRQMGKALKFMTLKLSFIIPNVLLNLVVFLAVPGLFDRYGVGLIFYVNLICTSLVFIGFIPELKGLGIRYDRALARRMLRYTWPLLILSIIGILNQVADKILFPYLMPGPEGQIQLGIYGACVKIAMIMSLLTQAFRYAYEPIVFRGSRNPDNRQTLADGMKYFVIFTLLAFMAVLFYMPILKHFIGGSYWEGLGVVPIVMIAEIFMGIYFNLSFWYKLSDRTWWGSIISLAGAAVMVGVNVAFVPQYGYKACAWGGFAGYGTAMLLSWLIGRRKYPVPYDVKKIFLFTVLCAVLCLTSVYGCKYLSSDRVRMGFNTILLAVYASIVFVNLKKNKEI